MSESAIEPAVHTGSFQSAVDRVAMGGPVRLDLGSGHKHEEGWVRVDFAVDRKKLSDEGVFTKEGRPLDPDVEADLLDLPFPDNYADEARAIHVIEHFQPWDAPTALTEWFRVLKPGAYLAIECPCIDKIVKLFDVPNIPPQLTYWGLYGDPRMKDPLMMHKWAYSEGQLMRLMEKCGFVMIRAEPPQFHQPIRDMRVVGKKSVSTGPQIVTPSVIIQ